MALNEQQFNEARKAGFSVEQIADFEKRRDPNQTTEPTEPSEPVKSSGQSIAEDYTNQKSLIPEQVQAVGRKIKSMVPDVLKPGVDMAAETLKSSLIQPGGYTSKTFIDKPVTTGTALSMGAGAGAATSVLGGLLIRAYAGNKLRTPEGQKAVQGIIDKGQNELNNTGVNPFFNVGVKKSREFIGSLSPQELTKGIEIATEAFGATALQSALNTVVPKMSNVKDFVFDNYMKSVKPSSRNVKSYGGATKFKQKVNAAVDSILDNSDNLKFTDVDGNVITKLPESLDEFSNAISQTKKRIFAEYDSMVTDLNGKGTLVAMNDIADDLIEAASSVSYEIANPSSQKYAIEMAKRLEDKGSLSLVDSQDLIEVLNQKLKNFYANPSADDASKAVLDAVVANRLRSKIDTIVDGTTNKKFSALKKQYGSLASVEKDIAKAAFKDAAQPNVGLIDFTDVFTVSDIISGLAVFSPGRLVRGGAGLFLKSIYKKLTNPNKLVSNMFKKANMAKNSGKVELLEKLLRPSLNK